MDNVLLLVQVLGLLILLEDAFSAHQDVLPAIIMENAPIVPLGTLYQKGYVLQHALMVCFIMERSVQPAIHYVLSAYPQHLASNVLLLKY